jgi:hypothetical protein
MSLLSEIRSAIYDTVRLTRWPEDPNEERFSRRRVSRREKRAIVDEPAASGNVISTAKRHRIQAHQIYRWRELQVGPNEPVEFVSVSGCVRSFVGPFMPPNSLPA